MTPMERDIEKFLGKRVRAKGGWYLKFVCPGFAGVPDRIILLPGGRIIFAEIKRPTGKLGALQKRWHSILTDLGFDCRTIWSHEDAKSLELEVLNNGNA